MPADLNRSNLFNPMSFWTDVGMSALDTALASTQNMTDGVDRLARAGARAEAIAPAPVIRSAPRDSADLPADYGFGLALQLQRSTFDMMAQAWQQWLSAVGTLASLGAGSSFRAVERQNPWLSALSERLAGDAETAATRAGSATPAREHGGNGPERRTERGAIDHALASAEPRRRSRGGRAKPKSASRSTGSSRGRR
ncbi:MAG: hypothetical protein ABI409_08945 [Ramlibacter sp.]